MSKVAVVTGACSGIGLALTKHLLSKSWSVVLADLQPPNKEDEDDLPTDRTLYIKTNVASFEDQARMFAEAFQWRGSIDFAALNAGIDDRDDIFASVDPSTPPRKPDMSTFEVDLQGVYYGIKLFAHYAARNPVPGGKIVATASVAGLYPNPGLAQYVAAKHGVIGLVRSLAPVAALHNITVNSIAPWFVATNLDPNLSKFFPERLMVTMSTVLRAFDELMDEKLGRNGATVEICPDGLFYRDPIEPVSPCMKELAASEAIKAWVNTYIQKNAKRTREREAATQ
jgi:NAD(P)-dependent dehydrogenase (short-subunit alcohol dehydrogenase family)